LPPHSTRGTIEDLRLLPSTHAPVRGSSALNDGQHESRRGVIYGLIAYLWWGFAVVYFYAVREVPSSELLAHRVTWLVPLLYALLAMRGGVGEVLSVLRRGQQRGTLILTTSLIGANWFVFIWATTNGRVVEASLGYFINPLVSVLLGFVFLKERLRRLQWVSVALAAIAVAGLILRTGQVPAVSVVLATTFAFYGLLRKRVAVGGISALCVETTMMWPWGVAFLIWLGARGELSFGQTAWLDALLLSAGLITAVPLIAFGNAVRRVDLSTIGFLQYLAPSLQFAIAVSFLGESIQRERLTAFGVIWIALALYSFDAWRASREVKLAAVDSDG
jgi:chloramphenicol-sensitive protein RarD